MKLIALCSFMLVSSSAFADESNVNLPVKDNQDPLFIKKCQEFRQAKADKDIDKMMSFVPKHFKDTEGEKKRAIAYLSKEAEKFQEYAQDPNFEITSIKISTKAPKKNASVRIEAKSGDKRSYSSGCAFENTKEDGWIIIVTSS